MLKDDAIKHSEGILQNGVLTFSGYSATSNPFSVRQSHVIYSCYESIDYRGFKVSPLCAMLALF